MHVAYAWRISDNAVVRQVVEFGERSWCFVVPLALAGNSVVMEMGFCFYIV
jgi:hypothetical protein